uniref:Putative terminase n=1 Tax=viral metagenome TaxID=1070528 RepID=A0A6M3K3R3_9ZZZZ
MPKTGPKPQPTALKKLRGNPGRRPLPKNEPATGKYARVPPPPRYLDRYGKNEWRRVAGQLLKAGLLTKVDRSALSAYCACYSTWLNAQDQIKKHGVLVKAPSGFPMQSPYLAISNKALEQMLKFLVEFGMTPSSRARVKADKPEEKKDPLAEFQAAGKRLEAVKSRKGKI